MKKTTRRNPNLRYNKPMLLRLEPRIMFDGAAVDTTVDVATGHDGGSMDPAMEQIQQAMEQSFGAAATGAPQDTNSSASTADQGPVIDGQNIDNANGDLPDASDETPLQQMTGSDANTDSDSPQEHQGLETSASQSSDGILVIIDSRVENYQSLLDELPENAILRVVEADESGLEVIGAELAKGGQFDAVHIISHGTPGSFSLGTDTINSQTLADQADSFESWVGHLSEQADILLYGCDLAQGDAGQAFINELARLTRADIAASTNATGAADQGGDWVLESATGSIEAGVIAAMGYESLLAAPTVTDNAKPDEPTTALEDHASNIGKDIGVTGTGTDSLTVTASVGKGTLNESSKTGTATEIQTWLAGITYSYTGTSETGDTDTLTLNITNTTNGGTTTFTRTFTIAAENDAPTLTPPASGAGRLSVAEGGTATFTAAAGNGTPGNPVTQLNLGLNDKDNTQNQIIIKLTGQPGQGILKLNGNELTVGSTFAVSDINKLVYHHNGSQVLAPTTDTFLITVDDGAGGLLTNQTVTIDITPVNQAPAVSGNITIIEGEQNIPLTGSSLPAELGGGGRGDISITDPDDASGHSLEITALPTHGTLKYNGATVSVGQTIANVNLSLFTYTHDGSETTADSFKVTVTDAGGGTGPGGKLTSAETTINLTIIPNNDDPYWHSSTLPDGSNAFGPVVFGPDAGGGAPSNTHTLPITQTMLHVVDAESPPERLTYTLTAIPSGGYLTSTDHPGQYLPVGFTFTQADINAGKINFVSTNGNNHTTDFKFTIMDGDRRIIPNARDGGIYADDGQTTPLTVHTFKIDYRGTATGTGPGGSPPTAAPVPTIDNNLGLTAANIAEGQTFTLDNTYLKASSTGSTTDQITYRLLTLPTNGSILLNSTALGVFGSFTQADIDAGRVKFQHDGSEDFTANFTFDVSNGSKITAVQTFSIDVLPQNDTPVAGQGDVVKLTEGSTIVLNAGGKNHITLSDSDNDPSDKTSGYAADNTLTFKVTALPGQGTLEWHNGTSWVAVTENQIITQTDLTAGKLRYIHNGTENYTDSFKIVPIDDKGVVGTSSNTDANTNPPSGNPTNQSSTGAEKIISISINPLNDAPTYVAKAEPGYDGHPAIKEGSTFTIWGAGSYTGGTYGTGSGTATLPSKDHYLIYQDSDNTSEQRQFRITTAPQYGVLKAGSRVLGVGSVFTQAELDSGAITYTHGGGEQFDDKFEYVVSDGDYTSNQGTTNNATAAAQGSSIASSEYRIKLERSNDKPIISTSHSGLFVVDSSNTIHAKNLPTITLGDIDLADGRQAGEENFVQITVEFLDNSNNPYANGVLQFESGDPADVSVTDAAGDNKLVFQGKLGDVQAALAKVQARTAGTDADLANLKIKVTIDDRLRNPDGSLSSGANGGALNQDGSTPGAGTDAFNTASIVIDVAASDKNDPPIVTVPGSAIVVHEDVRTQLTGTSAITYTDPDAFDSTSNTITLTVTHGSLYFAASGNAVTGGATVSGGAVGSSTVTLTGTKAQLDTALANLYYQGKTDYNGADSLNITVNDGGKNGLDGTDTSGGGSNSGAVAIHILPVNDPPTLTLPGENTYQSITGGSYTFSTANGNAIVIADDKDFAYTHGEDGQQHGRDDQFTVTLTAKQGGSGYGTITITTPGGIVTSNGSDTVTLTGSRAAINAALASGVTYAPAAGNLNGTITFEVLVDDQQNGGSKLTDPETGAAGIDGTSTVTKKLYFQPTDVNEAPGFSSLDNTPTFVQNGAPVVLDGDALLADPELDLFGASGNWNGAILTLERDGGANANDIFGFTGSGNTGVNVSGGNLRIGTTVVGTLTNSGGTLQITFNTAATAARVDQVLQAITYKNTEASPSDSVKINYTIDDQNPNNTGEPGKPTGSGQNQGTGGKLTGTGSITIGINRQVVATPDTNSINEAVTGTDPVTVTGDVTPGTTNSNDNGGSQDRDPDAGDTIVVQGVKAGTAGSVAAVGTGGVGTSVTGSYGSVVINADGTYTYTLDNNNATVNALKPGETLTDTFSYAINDNRGGDSTYAWTTLTITINGRNDPPVATDDSNSITEDSASVTGNVKTGVGGNIDTDPDNTNAELSITGIRTGKESGSGTAGSVGTSLTGQYGSLVINADGSYTYTLDNTNLAVQGLMPGETLKDEFTYTLSDGDKTDQATLTITINGADDPVTVTVPSNITQTTPDGNITDQVVFESGLASGSSPSLADTKVDSSFTLVVTDGLDATSAVAIGYTNASGNPAMLTLTKAEVEALGTTNKSVTTQYGTLVLDGYTKASNGTITIDYSYTLTSAPTVSGTDTNDSFTITAKDRDGDTDNKALTIKIVDDAPKAVADTGNVKANETLTVNVANGVLNNPTTKDSSGADGWKTGGGVVGVVAGNSVGTPSTANVGTEITTALGKLTLYADGSYVYVANPAASGAPPTTTDVFTYTVEDGDGDQTTTTLTITIQNNQPPVANDDTRTTPEDTPVSGNVIKDGGSGDVTDTDPDSDPLTVTRIVVNGTTTPVPSSGTVTVNIPGCGTLEIGSSGAYTFTPVADWHGTVPDVTYTIDDGKGGTVTADLKITVTPVQDAFDDSTSTPQGTPVTTPVLGNDGFSNPGNQVSILTPPSNGSAVVNPDGSITYTPTPDFVGTMTYTYRVTTPEGITEDAVVTVLVNAVPPPVEPPVPGEHLPPYIEPPVPQQPAPPSPHLGLDTPPEMPPYEVGRDPFDDGYTPEYQYELLLEKKIPDQPLEGGKSMEVMVPKDTFRHTDPGAKLTLSAAQVDGSPLPDWLTFNAQTGSFNGTPPAGYSGEMLIRVVARDENGRQVETVVRMGDKVADPNMPPYEVGKDPASGEAGKSVEYELLLEKKIPDQPLEEGGEIDFLVPKDTFRHTDPAAKLTLSAAMVDGSPLPDWLKFDANTGGFSGKVPAGMKGELLVKVIAKDDAGRQVETIVRISDQVEPVFHVSIDPGLMLNGEHVLQVAKGVPDLLMPFEADGAASIEYVIPMDAFVHTDPNARVELNAMMIDGSELPDWLMFDAKTGKFKGIPPKGFKGELQIKVIARDSEGRQAETILRIKIGEQKVEQKEVAKDKQVSRGKPSLTSVLKTQGSWAWKAERDRLVSLANELDRIKASFNKAG